jgi:translation initiation factor 3 subunit I
VVLGGGQDAMNVTMTDRRAGKFEAKFYHKESSFTTWGCISPYVIYFSCSKLF